MTPWHGFRLASRVASYSAGQLNHAWVIGSSEPSSGAGSIASCLLLLLLLYQLAEV